MMKCLIFFTFIALAQANLNRSKGLSGRFSQSTPRIVGGVEANLNEFPYQAALFPNNGGFCGGSIVGAKTILTSASCVDRATSIEVAVGELRVHTTPRPDFKISNDFLSIIDWDPWYRKNDVALVYLPDALIYTEAIKKIELFKDNVGFDQVTATVSGWGRFSDSSSAFSTVLRYATAEIISNDDCMKFFSPDVIKDTNLCLDGKDGKSACNGDVGGPLTVLQEDGPVQIGIASFGSPWGCSTGYPSVYSKIPSYVDWIKDNIKE